MPNHQFAFRKGLGTELQLVRVVEGINQGFLKKDVIGTILLDVEKVSDRVWRKGLVYKMIGMGIPNHITRLTLSFLQDLTFQIKLEGSRSTTRTSTAGVPQGAVLSATLFNIYIADYPSHPDVEIVQFADDTLIIARRKSVKLIDHKLQSYMDKLEDWMDKWKTKINAENSKAVMFTKRHVQPERPINYKGTDIPWVKEKKYLGVVRNRKITWRAQADHTANKGRAISQKLRPLLTIAAEEEQPRLA